MNWLKRVVIFDSAGTAPKELPPKREHIEELNGKLQFNFLDSGLMHSVLENDKEIIKEGKIASQSLDYRIPLNPEKLFEELVKNYSMTKEMYGEGFIREISGFSESYVEKNIRIPEFQRELKGRIEQALKFMKQHELINEDALTEKGIELASLIDYIEELNTIVAKGLLGKKVSKKKSPYGTNEDTRNYRKDRYQDLSISQSVKMALRRGHSEIIREDLRVFEKKGRGAIKIIYGLDSSGSMHGEKMEQAKKAGIALAYKAVIERDKVGVIVFGTKIKKSIMPTNDFIQILKGITNVKPYGETDISAAINEAARVFSFDKSNVTKHLILITDAMPTKGAEPEKETIKAASAARSSDVTVSIIGIKLDKKGKKLAEEIARIGQGRFYTARNLKEIDRIVLEDYYRTAPE
ncbi:MAG: VWA domain-containing protein [Candidatus Woesearchaeota archaeon]|nr:VWA domain-containing protein [Candidatus Woesearchaeota archaeon]